MNRASAIDQLLGLSSGPIGGALGPEPPGVSWSSELHAQLQSTLRKSNGFYAFETALHCFPAGTGDAPMSLEIWNSPELWRHEYGTIAEGLFFFAEDVFGNQFCFREGSVSLFDAETGDAEEVAKSLAEWAERILSEADVLTGHAFLRRWEATNGPLKRGARLVPRIPFVLGGAYDLPNLVQMRAVDGMRFRGNLARQIRDLPDGSQIEFRIVD